MHVRRRGMHGRKYDDRIFRTFLRSYMGIMLIPLIVSLIAYANMYGTALSSERERLEYMASQTGAAVDAKLSDVRSLMNQTLVSPQLPALITSEGLNNGNALITEAMKFKTYLMSFTPGQVVENYLVYFNSPNVLFCRDGAVYYDPYEYVENELRMDGMTREKWYALLSRARLTQYIPERMASEGGTDGMSRSVMLYRKPIIHNGIISGSMMAVIRTEPLIRQMRASAGASSDVALWLEDAAGRQLLASEGDSGAKDACNADASNWIITSFLSDDTALKYYVALPKSVALVNVYRSVGFMLVILLAALVLGVFAAVMLARRQGKPLDNISRNLSALYANVSEPQRGLSVSPDINYIDASINRLIDSHNAITDYLGRQTGLVERMFFEKLYAGLFDGEQDVTEMLGHLQLTPIDGPKRLLLARLEQRPAKGATDGATGIVGEPALDDAGQLTHILDEVLAQQGCCYRYEPTIGSCVLLMGAEGGGGQSPTELARALSGRFAKDARLRLRCAVSESFDDYVDVWRFYQNCTEALRSSDEDVIEARAQTAHAKLDYPVELESRIITLAQAGKAERVSEALDALAQGNADVPPIHLKYALGVTLARLRVQISERAPDVCARLDEAAHELDERAGVDGLCEQVKQLMNDMCAELEPQRVTRTNRKLDGIVEFINENYARADMSLAMLADRFNLTETYLSHVYKEHTGMNISGHIEQLRIERARELLREGHSLEQTAYDVGYGHVYSFRTAFKRVTGLTPGAYRDSCADGGAAYTERAAAPK